MNPYSRDLASPSSIETCLFDYQNNMVRTIFEKKKRKKERKGAKVTSELYFKICN